MESSKEKRYHSLYMQISHQVAQMSFCHRLKVGAIAVKDGRIISMGWNGQPAGFDNCCEENNITLPTVIHAESNMLAKIANSNEKSEGADVYVTHAPCLDCAKLLAQTKISRVFYAEEYRGREGLDFLKKCGILTNRMVVDS